MPLYIKMKAPTIFKINMDNFRKEIKKMENRTFYSSQKWMAPIAGLVGVGLLIMGPLIENYEVF